MNRRTFLQQSSGALGALALDAAPPSKPNVIWLFGDQHRAQALGCSGDPNARTPNIDRLAASGVQFTAALSGTPTCCPFRGSLMTGRYPHHCVPQHEAPLPPGQETIAKPFNDAGYRTAYFGKWHLDGYHERNGRAAMHIVPPERRGGFETWVGYENNNLQYDSWVHGGAGKDAFHYKLPTYETDDLTNLLIKYIKERGEESKAGKGKPFFAALSVQPPHNPYVAPKQYLERFHGEDLKLRPNVPPVERVLRTARKDLAGYYAMLENWDDNIGRVRQALRDAGLSMNTHIMLFSDHGDMHGSHGMYRKAKPFEEAMRIPFIMGGNLPAACGPKTGRFAVPLNHVDIAPTTLGLCGIKTPEWNEGTDYSHYRIAKTAPAREPDSAFLQWVVPSQNTDSTAVKWRGVVTRDGWKYVCFERTSWVMFNLNEDPYELANLAHDNAYRKQRKELIGRLKQWMIDTGDKFEVPGE